MKILDLHINGFGKFHDLDLCFSDGINVVYGLNEAGKSTLHTFIRCMLYGMERGRGRAAKNDLYSRYEPWDKSAAYGGRMRVEHRDSVYRLERNFRTAQRSFTIVDETAGCEIQPTRAFMDDLLGGLSETEYLNTISIGQLKSATDAGMVSELKNYIANMNTTGNVSLNITKATAYLKNRRKLFERQLHPEAAKEYAALTSEISDIETDISDPAYANLLRQYREKQDELRGELAQKQKEKEDLLSRIASQKQTLDSAGLADENAIAAYRRDAETSWAAYSDEKERCGKKTRTVCAVVSFIFAVIFAALAVYCLSAGSANPLGAYLPFPMIYLTVGFSVVCLIFLIAGIVIVHGIRETRRMMQEDEEDLRAVFSRNLGDNSVSVEAMNAFEGRMDELRRICRSLADAQAACEKDDITINSLREQDRSCEESISQQQKTQWELEKKLERLAVCNDRLETLSDDLSENEQIRQEIDAIDLSLETMTELSATIRDSFGVYLNKTASEMISGITGGVYDSISIDENLEPYLNTPEKLVPLSQVSSGAMDQIYLALRLAAAKLIQNGYEPMPLFFDDSFTQYDNERLASALEWLAGSYGGQIILFTCHRREAEVLSERGVPFTLTEI